MAGSVLLLHGFLGSERNLRSFARKWSDAQPDKKVIAADLLGHGQAPPLPDRPSLEALVPPVVAQLDALDAPVVVAGHSLGGRAALLAGLQRLDRVERVMLLDMSPAPIADRNESLEAVMRALLSVPAVAADRAEMRRALIATGLGEALADWLSLNLMPHGDGVTWRVDREALKQLGLATRGGDLWPQAEAVARAGKLRVVYGTASPFVQPDEVTRLRAIGAEVIALAGAGHYLHVDALDALVQACTTASVPAVTP